MILQERDKKLLEFLLKYGVLSTEQISTLCFSQIAHTTVMRRLRTLEKENLILRQSGLPGGMFAWYLTKFGSEKVGGDEPFRYTNRNTLYHEVTLSDLRVTLEGCGLGENWTSEVELRRLSGRESWRDQKDALIPDGLFVAIQNELPKVVAIELELQPKNHARYKKLFEHYRWKKSIAWVWYIAKTDGIRDLVLSQWLKTKQWPDPPGLMISLFEELKANPREAKVFFTDGEITKLGNFFKVSPLLSEKEKYHNLSAQGVSMAPEKSMSGLNMNDLKADQELASDQDREKRVPSGLDPSPPTLIEKGGEGSRPTGTEEVRG